jgi:ABC-2 type transport system ATP-binding protein
MIEVSNLTKYYGLNIGVRSLSFQVERGEVLGFLGPNGAGKTTTMKMLTCYLPPTSGTASICGHDILEESMEVRRRIGYLPEKSPLYQDMKVREYLAFVSSLKGVAGNRTRSEVDSAIERCGLKDVPHRTIGNLSKGYQQRVGIAQAILNEPELLILDEPTLGLDPKQIIDIRRLIRELGSDKTVLLSSHILPEVSQVCNRIIIINQGQLVAVDTPENLRRRLEKSTVLRVKLRNTDGGRGAKRVISEIDGVLMVMGGTPSRNVVTLTVETPPDRDFREEIAARLVDAKQPLLEIFSEELSLEDIFLKLVTREVN